MGMLGLEQVQLFWERSLDTKVLIGWSPDTIVISVRGTASLRNAMADIQVPSPPPHLCRGQPQSLNDMAAFVLWRLALPRHRSEIPPGKPGLETHDAKHPCRGCRRRGGWCILPSGGGGGWHRGPWCTAAFT